MTIEVLYFPSSVSDQVPTWRTLSRAGLEMLVSFQNSFAPITSLGCSTNPNLGQFARIKSLEAFWSSCSYQSMSEQGGINMETTPSTSKTFSNKHIVELSLLYYGINRMDVPQTVNGPNLITRLLFTSIRNLRALSGQGTMVALILPCV